MPPVYSFKRSFFLPLTPTMTHICSRCPVSSVAVVLTGTPSRYTSFRLHARLAPAGDTTRSTGQDAVASLWCEKSGHGYGAGEATYRKKGVEMLGVHALEQQANRCTWQHLIPVRTANMETSPDPSLSNKRVCSVTPDCVWYMESIMLAVENVNMLHSGRMLR